jgi:hypothetical protein
MSTCSFRPFPGDGAYGHWTCGRRRWHLGGHRFNNYTCPRIPHVWNVRRLWGAFQTDRRVRRINNGKLGYGYRRALFPTTYSPVDVGS